MKNFKQLLAVLLIVFTTDVAFGQIKPAIISIGNETFVLVVRANTNKEVGEKVVMSDFKASTENFDPNKMDIYPKWKIKTVNVNNNDGTYKRHIALYCIDNDKYYNQKKWGMLPAKEYEKYWEKDQAGNYIEKDRNGLFDFLFYPEIKDNEYIWLRIDDKHVVTPSTWSRRDIKLVLYSLK